MSNVAENTLTPIATPPGTQVAKGDLALVTAAESALGQLRELPE